MCDHSCKWCSDFHFTWHFSLQYPLTRKMFFLEVWKRLLKVLIFKQTSQNKWQNILKALSKFSKPNFIFQVLETFDTLEVWTKFSCICHTVNSCVRKDIFWLFYRHKKSCQWYDQRISGMLSEENFPSIVKYLDSLTKNIYQDCLLFNRLWTLFKPFTSSSKTPGICWLVIFLWHKVQKGWLVGCFLWHKVQKGHTGPDELD